MILYHWRQQQSVGSQRENDTKKKVLNKVKLIYFIDVVVAFVVIILYREFVLKTWIRRCLDSNVLTFSWFWNAYT